MPKQNQNKSVIIFEEYPVRRQWDEKKEKWYFSVVDIMKILTNSVDSGAYWRKFKQRLKEEGSEVVTKCHELKLLAKDGKKYLTDVADVETIFRLVQSVPSPKAEPVFTALAELSTTHIARKDKSKGYSENAVSAKKGGGIAKNARKQLEKATGEKVVSRENYLAGRESKKLKGK